MSSQLASTPGPEVTSGCEGTPLSSLCVAPLTGAFTAAAKGYWSPYRANSPSNLFSEIVGVRRHLGMVGRQVATRSQGGHETPTKCAASKAIDRVVVVMCVHELRVPRVNVQEGLMFVGHWPVSELLFPKAATGWTVLKRESLQIH